MIFFTMFPVKNFFFLCDKVALSLNKSMRDRGCKLRLKTGMRLPPIRMTANLKLPPPEALPQMLYNTLSLLSTPITLMTLIHRY